MSDSESTPFPGLRNFDALAEYARAETERQKGPTTPAAGAYGTDSESFYVNDRGQIYLVQSPDFADGSGDYRRVERLPDTAEELPESITGDLDIPEAIR